MTSSTNANDDATPTTRPQLAEYSGDLLDRLGDVANAFGVIITLTVMPQRDPDEEPS